MSARLFLSKMYNSGANEELRYVPTGGQHSLSSTNMKYKKEKTVRQQRISAGKAFKPTKTKPLYSPSAATLTRKAKAVMGEDPKQRQEDHLEKPGRTFEKKLLKTLLPSYSIGSLGSRSENSVDDEIDSHLPLPIEESSLRNKEKKSAKQKSNKLSRKFNLPLLPRRLSRLSDESADENSERSDDRSNSSSEDNFLDEEFAQEHKKFNARSRSLTFNGVEQRPGSSSRERIIVSSTPLAVLKGKQAQENKGIKTRRLEITQSSTFEEVDPISKESFGRLSSKQVDLKFRLNKEFDSKFTPVRSLSRNIRAAENEVAVVTQDKREEEDEESVSSFEDIRQVSHSELFGRLSEIYGAGEGDIEDGMNGEINKTLIDLKKIGEKDEGEMLISDQGEENELLKITKIDSRRKSQDERTSVLKKAMHNSFHRKWTLKEKRKSKIKEQQANDQGLKTKGVNAASLGRKAIKKHALVEDKKAASLKRFEDFDIDFDNAEKILQMMRVKDSVEKQKNSLNQTDRQAQVNIQDKNKTSEESLVHSEKPKTEAESIKQKLELRRSQIAGSVKYREKLARNHSSEAIDEAKDNSDVGSVDATNMEPRTSKLRRRRFAEKVKELKSRKSLSRAQISLSNINAKNNSSMDTKHDTISPDSGLRMLEPELETEDEQEESFTNYDELDDNIGEKTQSYQPLNRRQRLHVSRNHNRKISQKQLINDGNLSSKKKSDIIKNEIEQLKGDQYLFANNVEAKRKMKMDDIGAVINPCDKSDNNVCEGEVKSVNHGIKQKTKTTGRRRMHTQIERRRRRRSQNTGMTIANIKSEIERKKSGENYLHNNLKRSSTDSLDQDKTRKNSIRDSYNDGQIIALKGDFEPELDRDICNIDVKQPVESRTRSDRAQLRTNEKQRTSILKSESNFYLAAMPKSHKSKSKERRHQNNTIKGAQITKDNGDFRERLALLLEGADSDDYHIVLDDESKTPLLRDTKQILTSEQEEELEYDLDPSRQLHKSGVCCLFYKENSTASSQNKLVLKWSPSVPMCKENEVCLAWFAVPESLNRKEQLIVEEKVRKETEELIKVVDLNRKIFKRIFYSALVSYMNLCKKLKGDVHLCSSCEDFDLIVYLLDSTACSTRHDFRNEICFSEDIKHAKYILLLPTSKEVSFSTKKGEADILEFVQNNGAVLTI